VSLGRACSRTNSPTGPCCFVCFAVARGRAAAIPRYAGGCTASPASNLCTPPCRTVRRAPDTFAPHFPQFVTCPLSHRAAACTITPRRAEPGRLPAEIP
jgi:hypothetical protein